MGNPKTCNKEFKIPEWPKIDSKPNTATITGRMKGTLKATIKSCRPLNCLRDKAKAKGHASNTDKRDDREACSKVNSNAALSAAVKIKFWSAWNINTNNGPKTTKSKMQFEIIEKVRFATLLSLA